VSQEPTEAIARRRAVRHARLRLAEDRWRRWREANLSRRKHGVRLPAGLAQLLARGKSPGRVLLLAASGLWLPDVESGLGSVAAPALDLADYVRAGPDPAAQPRGLFDQAWYLDRTPSLAAGRWPPLAHYLILGDAAGLAPHPLLDARRYHSRHGEALGGLTALQHFLGQGAAEGRDPHPLFDLRFYVGQSETLARSGENPLVHYLSRGWREGVDPHPMFAGDWYLARYPAAARAGIAPLLHYLTAGARDGLDPHPLFDTAWWRAQGVGRGQGGDPLSDFLLGRSQRSPTPRFDPAHYLAAAGAAPAARANPLLHYLTVGSFEGLSPAPGFDEAAWFASHPEAADSGRSALELIARAQPAPVAAPTPPPQPKPVRRKRLTPPPATGLDVSLVGYPFAPTGMGEHGRSTVRALRAVGVAPRIIDAAPASARDPDLDREFAPAIAEGLGRVNLFAVNADEADRVIDRLGRPAFAAAYNIAYPAWELARYPAAWAQVLAQFDEVWAPSAFVREALAQAVPRPVFHIPLAVEPELSSVLDRAWFDIPEDAFAVLFFFDFASYAARKNPGAVLDAFEILAARRPEAPLHLVIKTRGQPASAAERRAFDARVARLHEGVQVIDADLSDNEIKNLVAVCDVFVSLHRSEGFGRGMAEAMALGRPAIATGYSGNLDFMTPDTSLLVDHRLVPVGRGEYPHGEGQVWADPSPEHAAALIERLIDDPSAARALGARARRRIRQHFSNRAVGLRALERLRAIHR
jgi:glycosyltransferase involved in cell wall biosynthesis